MLEVFDVLAKEIQDKMRRKTKPGNGSFMKPQVGQAIQIFDDDVVFIFHDIDAHVVCILISQFS